MHTSRMPPPVSNVEAEHAAKQANVFQIFDGRVYRFTIIVEGKGTSPPIRALPNQ